MANLQVKDLVGSNLRRFRGETTLAELSARLTGLGQPIGVSTLSKIELGQRRISVDDLVALAAAVGVAPQRLLAPPTESVVHVRELFQELDMHLRAVRDVDGSISRVQQELSRLFAERLDVEEAMERTADAIAAVVASDREVLDQLSASERSHVWQLIEARKDRS